MVLYEFKNQISDLRLRLRKLTLDYKNALIDKDYITSVQLHNDIVNIMYIVTEKLEDYEQEIRTRF